ncbi:MAG: hypothetical protein RI967_2501 [Planctomycetota bacterium]
MHGGRWNSNTDAFAGLVAVPPGPRTAAGAASRADARVVSFAASVAASLRALRVVLGVLFVVACAAMVAPRAHADARVAARVEPATGVRPTARVEVRPLVARVHAVVGAPILVPVQRLPGRGSSREPSATEVRWTGGERASSRFLWPRLRDGSAARRWAEAAQPVALVDARPANAVDAWIAIEAPADGEALPPAVEIAGARVALDWHRAIDDDALARIGARLHGFLPRGDGDPLLAQPDPDAPFERFRAELGARLGVWSAPPAFPEESADACAARASTALWLAALGRIAAVSEGAATELVELLLARCRDPVAGGPIAAWLAAPGELASILELALAPNRTGDALAQAVVSWMRVRSPLVVWIEDTDVDHAMLAVANPTAGDLVLRFQWIAEQEPPLAALLPAAETTRVRIPRAARVRAPRGAVAPELLRLEHDGHARTIAVTPAEVPAGVAGLSFAGFLRPTTLVDAASGLATAGAALPEGRASIRPRLDGWEIYLELEGVSEAAEAEPGAPQPIEVELFGGARHATDGAADLPSIRIRADGLAEDPTGLLAGTGYHARRHGDTLRVGFLVPPGWLDRVEGRAILSIGMRRAAFSGGGDAPYPSVPWRPTPRLARIDLLARDGAPILLYSAP